MTTRAFSLGKTFHREKEGGDLIVDMAFASEEPYERWWGVEILDCSEQAVRLERANDGAPILFNHNWNDLRGTHVPKSVKCEDGHVRGKARITSATAIGRETISLVESEILTKASVGYQIHRVIEQTTTKAGVKVERAIPGAVFERALELRGITRAGGRGDGDVAAFRRSLDDLTGNVLERASDDVPVYRVVDWEILEDSLVTVPADNTVGVGRSAASSSAAPQQVVQPAATAAVPSPSQTSEIHMRKKHPSLQDQANDGTGGSAGGASSNTNQPAGNTVPAQARSGPNAMEMETERRTAIENLCKANNIDDGIRSLWVSSGASMLSVSNELMQILQERAKNTPKATQVGLTDKEVRKFSLSRAIEACAAQNWTNAGFEAEVSRTIQGKLNRTPSPNRFFVPWEVQERQNMTPLESVAYSLMRRDLTVASAGNGGYLKETANVGFIELLRNKSVLMNMGAMRLSGLVGDVTIPKQSATGSATWLANESAAISEINQTFVQVALSPKNVGGYTEISRQLLLQSNPYVEGLVMSDLASVVALDIDAKGLNGSGASGQPTGILNTSGIGSVTGTSLDYADIVEFQTDVFAGNALTGNSGYVTTGAVAGLLKARVKFSSTASPIWDGRLDQADVDGYKGMASNQMPSATMLFGDFGLGVVIAEWGVLEVEVNPYANFQAGIVGVRAIASVDIGLRYPTAFSAASSIT